MLYIAEMACSVIDCSRVPMGLKSSVTAVCPSWRPSLEGLVPLGGQQASLSSLAHAQAAGVLCLMDIAAGMEHLHSLGVLHVGALSHTQPATRQPWEGHNFASLISQFWPAIFCSGCLSKWSAMHQRQPRD